MSVFWSEYDAWSTIYNDKLYDHGKAVFVRYEYDVHVTLLSSSTYLIRPGMEHELAAIHEERLASLMEKTLLSSCGGCYG